LNGAELTRLIDQPELRAEVSAVELTKCVLDRIDRGGEINSFITVTPELALADARRVDELRARGQSAGPLDGMPIALKDNIDLAGVRCTAGSDWFRDRVADEDAESTRRLRAAGAVFVGKTTLHEFAYGATNDNAHYGPCRNPWDLERVPGGSSGGSGAAVGADLCLGALGTDTGGSVRIPAALNGVTGMRHTYGAVSNRGVLPICASLDTVGPMARSAVDVARLAAVIVGYDRHDPYAIEPPAAARLELESGERLEGLRVGVANAFYFDDVDPAVRANARVAADVLANLGAQLVEVDVSDSEEAMQRTTLFSRAEALALHRERLEQDPGRFGDDVRRRLELGYEVTGADVAAALDFMRHYRARMIQEFEGVDMILTPTAPSVAPKIESSEMIAATAHLTRFCYAWSLAWLPAISLPSGLDENGLPTGVQLAAAPWRDGLLLRAGIAFQSVTDFHRARPPELPER
jgi:aspartyl-tRNA(Asn)/glutamyl-tRNA(Gln) amidotransferase subunit A